MVLADVERGPLVVHHGDAHDGSAGANEFTHLGIDVGDFTGHLGPLNGFAHVALHLLHGTTGLTCGGRSCTALLVTGTVHGHLIIALCSLDLCLCRFVHGLGLVKLLGADDFLLMEFLHAIVGLLGNFKTGLCLLQDLGGSLNLLLAGTVLCHLCDGRCGVGSALGLHHLGIHLGSLDNGERVACVYKVTFLGQESKDTSRHFTRHTVFLDFHFALDFLGVALQGQVTDESDNEDHGGKSEDC